MNHVLGELFLADQPQREAVGSPGVAAIQGVERPSIAAREAPMELLIFPGAVLHGPYPRRAMASPTLHHVVLFARPGCHLCDVARATLEAVRSRHPFALQEVDIETDDALVREYGMRIPVVAVDGVDTFEVDVPEARLVALVRM